MRAAAHKSIQLVRGPCSGVVKPLQIRRTTATRLRYEMTMFDNGNAVSQSAFETRADAIGAMRRKVQACVRGGSTDLDTHGFPRRSASRISSRIGPRSRYERLAMHKRRHTVRSSRK